MDGGSPAGDLLAQFGFEGGNIKFLLAQQGKLAAGLQAEEVGEAVASDALEAGGVQQHAVDVGEACRIVAEHGAGEHVPLPAVG